MERWLCLQAIPPLPSAQFSRDSLRSPTFLFALPRLRGLFIGYKNGDVLTFEKVHCRAARFVLYYYNQSTRSCDLVCKPVWDSLEADRRFLAQTPMFYLITEKLLEISLPTCNRPAARSRACILAAHTSVLAHRYSPFFRAVRVWNRLSWVTVNTGTTEFRAQDLRDIL